MYKNMDFSGYDPNSEDKNMSFFLNENFLAEVQRNIDNIKKTQEVLNDVKSVLDVSMFEPEIEDKK